MNSPFVISINAVSGGGKTSLTKLLDESLVSSKALYFDEFDSTNVYPFDFYEWNLRGSNLSEFDCPGMHSAVIQEIQDNNHEYIILDFPFAGITIA